MNDVILTRELIHAGKNGPGGWNAAQLAAIGIFNVTQKGWIERACGKVVSAEAYQRFLSMRYGYVPPSAQNDDPPPPTVKPSGWSEEVWEIHLRIQRRIRDRMLKSANTEETKA